MVATMVNNSHGFLIRYTCAAAACQQVVFFAGFVIPATTSAMWCSMAPAPMVQQTAIVGPLWDVVVTYMRTQINTVLRHWSRILAMLMMSDWGVLCFDTYST